MHILGKSSSYIAPMNKFKELQGFEYLIMVSYL